MKQFGKILLRIIYACVIFAFANFVAMNANHQLPIWMFTILLVLFFVINVTPSIYNRKLQSKRLRFCGNGIELLIIFLVSTTMSVIYGIGGYIGTFSIGSIVSNPMTWIINTLVAIVVEAIVFWNGIIRVYTSSEQLGIKLRVIGIVCGWIPVAHLIVLGIIISTATKEITFENMRIIRNAKRKDEQICKTKYPVLLVHGVFFRDFRYLNYWGRVPKELEENGATIYYGNHQSAASVEECGKELAARIKEIVEDSGCGKVNIIAHSKGGLDSRYAISMLGIDDLVATLTTINTPHRGCEFADYLLSKIPEKQKNLIANTYNSALRKLGDINPDFIAAVTDLTAQACNARNETVIDKKNVHYESVGSKLNYASSGRFPLNFSYHLVNLFDGKNDGLVGEKSFPWGESFQFLTVRGKRGISHGDMIDLNRENIQEFDVREFYVNLVADLRKKGF